MKKNILISTGGSGGHVVPATILYEHLKDEFNIFITSDDRGVQFLDKSNNLWDLEHRKHQKIFFYYHSKIFSFKTNY